MRPVQTVDNSSAVSGNQQFVLALILGLVAGIPPAMTAFVLYKKALAQARIDADRTRAQLVEVHQIVNSRLDRALNSMKVLEEALRSAGIKIPPTPTTPEPS